MHKRLDMATADIVLIMAQQHADGMTLGEIGRAWNYSAAGIKRMLNRAGIPTRTRKEARNRRPELFGRGCRKGAPNAGAPRKVSP